MNQFSKSFFHSPTQAMGNLLKTQWSQNKHIERTGNGCFQNSPFKIYQTSDSRNVEWRKADE